MEVGEYRPNDPVYDKEHRQEIERELERISELEEQRAQRQISSSEWMKDVENIEEWELDAPEFEGPARNKCRGYRRRGEREVHGVERNVG